MKIARGRFGQCNASVCAAVVVGAVLAGEASAQSRIRHQFQSGTDFQGQVQRVTVDDRGVAWVATTRELFKVEHGTLRSADAGAMADTQLVLAPGADHYARLTGGTSPTGLFRIDFRSLVGGARSVDLRDASASDGFDTLHLGNQGKLIVTSTPLQNAEGLRGEFLYVFWSRDGTVLGRSKVDGPRNGIFDPNGEAILLLGKADAAAFSRTGQPLWRVSGSFRNGAIADAGDFALLNPARAIDELHIVRQGTVTTVKKMPGPVHELALTPDGNRAAVASNAGQVSFLDTRNCDARDCRLSTVARLPIADIHYVTAIQFIDRSTVAIAVIQETGTSPDTRYETGAILAVTTAGRVKFNAPIKVPQPATWSPLLDVTFGEADFGAFTRDAALVVRIE